MLTLEMAIWIFPYLVLLSSATHNKMEHSDAYKL